MANRVILTSFLWVLVVLAGAAVIWLRFLAPEMQEAAASTLGRGDYQLETTRGETFTEASLEGAPSAVFFGFTHCPEVCPTTLGDIATWREELGPEGEKLEVFFITVDPERDSLEVLENYLSWAPNVTGVTGSLEAVEQTAEAFRIYMAKVPLGDDYTMDHSSLVLLFDEKGRFFEPIGYQEDFDVALDRLRRLIKAYRPA